MKGKYGINIKWLTVTCLEINCADTTIVSDPFITDASGTEQTWEDIENCDYITLSHAHWDHITDIPRLIEKFQPLIFTGDQTAMPLAQWTNYNPTRIYPMYPDQELDFDTVKIKALYGRHTDLGRGFNDLMAWLAASDVVRANPEINPLQVIGSLEYRNYLFTFPNGTKLLLWGNDATVEQRNMLKKLQPDIAVLQYTKQDKDPEGMARFARDMGAKVLIPHHMDLIRTEEEYMPKVKELEEAFLRLVPDGTFLCPRHGQWMHL